MDGIVMRVYGIGPDDGEVEGEECTYCHSTNTSFIKWADEARNTEIHFCHDCEQNFTIEVEIPF